MHHFSFERAQNSWVKNQHISCSFASEIMHGRTQTGNLQKTAVYHCTKNK